MPDVKLYHGDNEWSALYIDGKLDRVGDHYLNEERIHAIFGVEDIYDEEEFWMRGDYTGSNVAESIEEIEEYKSRCLTAEARAAALRAQADELIRQAKEIVP